MGHGLAKAGLSAEEWDYYNARKNENRYDPSDPKQNNVKHVYVHNDNKQNKHDNVLQKRIDKTISKILDLNILPDSDKKSLIKTLTGSID